MAQLLIEGTSTINTDTPVWTGVNIPRLTDTDLIYRRNFISSLNTQGYMLCSGDENVNAYNNNLDGALIYGNKLVWGGTPSLSIITHGIFTGYNINVHVKYNYLDGVPMGIVRKSNGMTDTSGMVAYNIVKNGKPGIVVKGMNGIKIYNNTLYSSLTSAVCNRSLVEVYENSDISPVGSASGAKIKNNIFYTVYKGINSIWVGNAGCLTGFECDYNIYWCEEGDNLPSFNYLGSIYTWAQWRALGYDTHSVVINPNFFDTITFVPRARLNYGVNLGTTYLTGLALGATWDLDRLTDYQNQDGTWQVGARIYGSATDIGADYYVANWGSDTNDGSFNSPFKTWERLDDVMVAGDLAYIRGGIYRTTYANSASAFSRWHHLHGTALNPINILNYPDESPVLNLDNVVPTYTYIIALYVYSCDYLNIKGLRVTGLAQTALQTGGVSGIFHTTCTYCTIELCDADHLGGYGFVVNQSHHITWRNCDAHHLADPYHNYENANGFNATGGDTSTFLYFYGCRAWCCCDDGWDFFDHDGYIEIDRCWAFWNGYSDEGITPYGGGADGNGFKLGPCFTDHATEHLRTVKNSLAVRNMVNGFDQNTADFSCIMWLYNNVAFGNYNGFEFNRPLGIANILRNNIAYSNSNVNAVVAAGATNDHNSWNGVVTVTDADFKSLIDSVLDGVRQSDGSLPKLDFLHLETGSDLRNAGINLGGANGYDGDGYGWNAIPSIGAFEYIGAPGVGIKYETTITHSVPTIPMFVRDIPAWMTVWNDDDAVEVLEGGQIASGTTLALYPNSQNNGAERTGVITIEDNTPYLNNVLLTVTQGAAPLPISVNVINHPSETHMYIDEYNAYNAVGSTLVVFDCIPWHSQFGEGALLNLRIMIRRNNSGYVYGVTPTYIEMNNMESNGPFSVNMTVASSPGDTLTILLWTEPLN